MSDAATPAGCPHFDHHRSYPDEASRYADYDALRACPVGRSDAHGGFWVLARHDDVVEAADGKRVTGLADPDGVLFEVREA